MNEERWHNFAKEKPSEDIEGRNFIVSNGHYEKIATWCGYWENEPFMGDHLCDEVVRWKFYFTPEEEKANEATRTEPKPMKCDELEEEYLWTNNVKTPSTIMVRVYNADEVDAAIAELKARIQLDDDEMAGFLDLEEECGGGDLRNYIAELKQKLEDVQASAYEESVDAGMRERRLRRALWHAIALFCARSCEYFNGIMSHCLMGQDDLYKRCEEKKNKYIHAMYKCRAKEKEYK
jgi:hypothetical protein